VEDGVTSIPARYRPHLAAHEFIAEPAAGPEERIDVGVLFVGAGPAGLAGAIRLSQLLESAPEVRERLGEVPIAVVEKGKHPGAHLVSGAVINPIAFRRLFPDLPDAELPFRAAVAGEALYMLTARRAFKAPLLPPSMHNRGNFTACLAEVGRWLGERAEAAGVMLLNETTAQSVLVKDGAVHGVHTADKGLGRDRAPLANFEPGVELHAQATVLAEGVLSHLTAPLIERFGLAGTNPQIHALGVKEIWDVPGHRLDRIIHTMGWPLRISPKYHEFGGGWIYPLGPDQISIGIVVGLDHADATLSVHDLLQEFKLHPLVRRYLEGGRRNERGWGAKTIPEGGWHALPTRLGVPGALFTGDCAGFVNVPALKGTHYAMWSGILAAEAIFAALRAGTDPRSDAVVAAYERAVRDSFIWNDLYRVRNMRQVFELGFAPGVALAGMMAFSGGRVPPWRFGTEEDAEQEMFDGGRQFPKRDGVRTFDKLSSVYASGNRTRDTQPNHLRVVTDVPKTVGDTWIHMCPAAVYEWAQDETGRQVLRVNPPNCVQCGAITAKGGRFTPPEGGSGPEYSLT
jgi:electron-transferring-flavoprotein dehydrogenase